MKKTLPLVLIFTSLFLCVSCNSKQSKEISDKQISVTTDTVSVETDLSNQDLPKVKVDMNMENPNKSVSCKRQCYLELKGCIEEATPPAATGSAEQCKELYQECLKSCE